MPQQVTLPSTSNSIDFNEFIQKLLYTNDVTAVESYNRTIRPRAEQTPEHELWFEVFRGAIYDYTQNIEQETSSQKRIFEEVFDWFFNEHVEKWPMSFENICETLNFEPNYYRRLLIVWTKRYFTQSVPVAEEPSTIPPKVVYPKFVDINSIL